MNKRVIRTLAGLVLLLPVWLHSLGVMDWRWLRELEYQLYDLRLRATAETGIDPRVVIVDIDERSLAVLGQWPWKRDILATIIARLFEDYGVDTLGLDVLLAEPDVDPTFTALQEIGADLPVPRDSPLGRLLHQPSRDELLRTTLAQYDVVLGYVFGRDPDQENVGTLPGPLFDKRSGVAGKTDAPEGTRYSGNLALLQEGLTGGFFSLLDGVDSDGIIRRVPLLNRFDDAVYPSLSLAMATRYLGSDIRPVLVEAHGEYRGLEALDLGLFRVDMDQDSAVHVPYRADRGLFRRLSALDVYRGAVVNADEVAGTIAILGTSAAGLGDNRATPIHQVFPGVEIHASLTAGLLDGGFRSHPGWATALENLLLLAIGVALLLLLPGFGAFAMTLLSLGLAAAVTAGNLVLWSRFDHVIALAPLLVGIFLVYAANMLFGYLAETRSRLQLKRSFGLYVPPQIIDRMQGQSVEALLRSEKREMTVLFTDIRGFTTISEQLSPQDLSLLMNAFLTPMTAIVHRHGGAIDKYMGDAMMAFWGAPMDDPDHAGHALDAALEMVDCLESLNRDFVARGWPRIRIGVGLNTGPMSVGNMGSEFRMAYTVLGDAVNLGSRLEGLTAKYGVTILLSETTAGLCRNTELVLLDQVRVKGKLEPVKIYMPLGTRGEINAARRELMARFERFQALYFRRQWDDAADLLSSLVAACAAADYPQAVDDGRLFGHYLERTRVMQQTPPGPEWDGVTEFRVK